MRNASSTLPVMAWSGSFSSPPSSSWSLTLRINGISPGELPRARFEETERRRVGVAPGVDRKLVMVERVIRRRVGRERTRRPVLEALVHRQDHELARAREAAGVHDAGEIGEDSRVVAAVPGENFFDASVFCIAPLIRLLRVVANGPAPRSVSAPALGAALWFVPCRGRWSPGFGPRRPGSVRIRPRMLGSAKLCPPAPTVGSVARANRACGRHSSHGMLAETLPNVGRSVGCGMCEPVIIRRVSSYAFALWLAGCGTQRWCVQPKGQRGGDRQIPRRKRKFHLDQVRWRKN